MKHLKVITWARWTLQDPFSPEYYTVFTASILKPSWEYPIACASIAITKGRNKVFMRMNYPDLLRAFIIPEEYTQRLDNGYHQALEEAYKIQKQQITLHQLSNLPPGGLVVRTDTGEIIAQAEQIIREHQDQNPQV